MLLILIIMFAIVLCCKNDNNDNETSKGINAETTRSPDIISNYTKSEVKKNIENIISFYEDSLETVNNLLDVLKNEIDKGNHKHRKTLDQLLQQKQKLELLANKASIIYHDLENCRNKGIGCGEYLYRDIDNLLAKITPPSNPTQSTLSNVIDDKNLEIETAKKEQKKAEKELKEIKKKLANSIPHYISNHDKELLRAKEDSLKHQIDFFRNKADSLQKKISPLQIERDSFKNNLDKVTEENACLAKIIKSAYPLKIDIFDIRLKPNKPNQIIPIKKGKYNKKKLDAIDLNITISKNGQLPVDGYKLLLFVKAPNGKLIGNTTKRVVERNGSETSVVCSEVIEISPTKKGHSINKNLSFKPKSGKWLKGKYEFELYDNRSFFNKCFYSRTIELE